MEVNKRARVSETIEEALRGAAFHEAGHVVVACFLGLAVRKIEIHDDGSGKATISSAEHLPLIDQIALCVAGVEAHVLFGCDTHDYGAFDDYVKFSKLVEGLTKAESVEYRNAAYLRALDILRSHATDVERLANDLIERRYIAAIDVNGTRERARILPRAFRLIGNRGPASSRHDTQHAQQKTDFQVPAFA